MSSGPESVDRQQWDELKTLFYAALERPRDDWPAMVNSVRERDADLAERLQRLLDGHVDTLIPVGTIRLELLYSGTRLGPYVINGLIGEGGMGRVYRARDERLGREVAVKVLPPELAHDPDRRGRMEREARAMGMLNHPNVVTVHDIGDYRGSPFIVSELLEGQTLRQQMADGARRGSRLSASRAVAIVAAVADALGAAHRRGIVHRDIKPENVFLTSDGRIKVLDFGIAKLADGEAAGDGTAVGAMIGTLGYMSPEQLRGEAAVAATDIYACGVVLFELLSGRRPHVGKSQAAIIGAILHEEPEPPPGLTPALTAVVLRCLDKRAAARFPDGVELAETLRALTGLEAGTDDAAQIAGVDRPTKRLASRRAMLVASALLLLTSAALGSMVWSQWRNGGSMEPPPGAIRADIVLPAPSTAPLAAASDEQRPEESPVPDGGRSTARASQARPQVTTPIENNQAMPVESAPSLPQPADQSSPAVPPLDGVWTISEQIAEDMHAIECVSAGALQLRSDDGLLEGTLRLKRDCKDEKRATSDSTETTSALSVGTHTRDAVAFVTRVVDEGLATTCRYSAQIVGSSRGTMAGEVTCEARSVGLTSVLTLHGTWRASRLSP